MTYDLAFEITPELYRRAVTQPLVQAPSGRRLFWGNMLALFLATFALTLLGLSLFDSDALPQLIFGGCVGAALVAAAWWKQHRTLVRLHSNYNATGGPHRMQIDASRIVASRPHVESRIDWPFVRAIRQIDGAVLIELPTARLVVPVAALPEGQSADAFAGQLETWRTA